MQELAALVTAYAAEDLRSFQYPAWVPSTDAPAPESGPALQGGSARVHDCTCYPSRP